MQLAGHPSDSEYDPPIHPRPLPHFPPHPDPFQVKTPPPPSHTRTFTRLVTHFFCPPPPRATPSHWSNFLPDIRDVQLNTTLALANVAIASATDLGDLYGSSGAIHPGTRWPTAAAWPPPRPPWLYACARAGARTHVRGRCRHRRLWGHGGLPAGHRRPAWRCSPRPTRTTPGRLRAFNLLRWPALLGSDGVWRNATSWGLGQWALYAGGGTPPGGPGGGDFVRVWGP
jgi:hypothetical protein